MKTVQKLQKHVREIMKRKETKMDSRISIIIGLYDANTDTNKIKNTIESALNQNKDLLTEVLICADVVSEKVKNFLSEYENKEKVKVFYTSERRGRGGAFNLGLLKSFGGETKENDWICFLNAGDTLNPSFAEKLIKKADENKETDVVSCADNTDESNMNSDVFKEALKMEDYEKKALITVNSGRMESKIYKKNIFTDNGLWFPVYYLFEKEGIGRLALLCAKNFDFVDEKLYSFDKEKTEDIAEEDLYDRIEVMSFFLEECYKREFLEEFPEEVESVCIDEMYMKPLFTYIAITPAKKRKVTFLKMLQEEMLDCFPEFETNPYYYEKYDDDIKDLIELHMANPNKFLKATMKMDAL